MRAACTIVRRVIVVALFVALLAAVPAAASADTIEGSFEFQRKSTSWKDPIPIRGWAVSHCGSPEVALVIDGREVITAHPWLDWPGIRERFPGVASAQHPGFETVIDPLHFAPGDHRVAIVASSPECHATRSLGELIFVSAAAPRPLRSWLIVAFWIAVVGAIAFALRRSTLRYHPLPLWWIVPPLLVVVIVAIATAGGPKAPFERLANWDGSWYMIIARQGYVANGTYAFFPLFPLMLRALSLLPVPLELAASIANAVLFAGSLRFLQKLRPHEESGLLFYAALPFAFFFVAVYTESLALFLSVAFVLSLRERKPALALVCGCLAGLTRITSLALVMFGIDEVRNRRLKSAIASIGPVAGLTLHMTWLRITSGDPLRFMTAQERFGRATSFSAGRLVQLLARCFRTDDPWDVVGLVTLALVAIAAAMLILGRRYGEGLYCGLLITLPLATLSLTSLHRYALLAFPAFPLLGGLLRSRALYWTVVALEIWFLIAYARHFGRGDWVG